MTIGMSKATADGFLAAFFQGIPFVVTEFWVQMHVGDPGPDGTGNPAAETRRMDCSAAFGTDPVDDGSGAGEIITSDSDVGPWDSAAATEDWTHGSFWSGESGGDFLGSGALTTTKSVTAGDDVTLPAGHMTCRVPNAA